MAVELTSLIVAGVLAGILCVILLFVIPVVCYIRRKSPQSQQPQPNRKQRHEPKPVANGNAKQKRPRKQQNGIPMSKLNGATRSPRQHNDMDSPGSIRMTPFQYPHMGPVPMVGTFRGPPPQPIIIGTSSYSRGTYPRGMYPRGNPSRGRHARGTHSRANPYMAHMMHTQYPPMAYPYFFGQQYPVQVVYVSDSEDSDSTTSGRSTVRERKSRYHRQFVTSRVPSTIVIKEMDEDQAEVRQSRDVHKKRTSSPVKAPVREEPVIMRNRSRSPSRSRSRSPPMAIYQDLRLSSRPPADPARKEEKDSSSEFGTFQPAAGPKLGDVAFVPKGHKLPERNPTPEPEDYTYATVIKPQPVKPSPTDDWGEPDQDIGLPSQNIGLSMSERLQGIVEDGWGASPPTEVPPQHADLRKSTRDDETDVLRQSRQPDENSYTHNINREENPYSRNINRDENPYTQSVKRSDTYPPPSPPLDIPSAAASPRQSFHRDYPSSEPNSPDRPITPPFDGITPRPSVKSRSESPPRPSTSANPLSQSQSEKAHRTMFSNDVLKELKQRQKSTDNLVEDDDSQSRSVNFSPSPPTIISQDNSLPLPPPQFNGIPAPPPPPPLPK